MSSPREGDTDLIVLNDKLYAFISTRKAPTKKIRALFTIKLLILPTGAYFQAPRMTLNQGGSRLQIIGGAGTTYRLAARCHFIK